MTEHQFSLSIFGQLVAANKSTNKSAQKISQKEKEAKLSNETREKVLKCYAESKEDLSAKDITQLADISVFSAASMIKRLTNSGHLKFVSQKKIDKSKQNFYRITEKGKHSLEKMQSVTSCDRSNI